MATRRAAERTLVDAAVDGLGSQRRTIFFDKMASCVPWDLLEALVLALPEYGPAPKGGRPAVAPGVMLRALMVAKWHNLSDTQLEDQLADSLAIRRFVGLTMHEATPDATSFTRFRQRLEAAGLLQRVHEVVLAHLDQQGVTVRQGTIADATFIEARKGGRRADGTPTRDPDAAYVAKAGKPHFGYKAHATTDLTGIFRDVRVTHANVHDAKFVDEMTANERVAVYADSAFHQRERRAMLQGRGVQDAIAYQRRRGQATLTPAQQAWNAMIRPIRVAIEHAFGRLKQTLGPTTRYRGLRSNTTNLLLSMIAHNMRHGAHLLTR
jgi:transposase, IS5 family